MSPIELFWTGKILHMLCLLLRQLWCAHCAQELMVDQILIELEWTDILSKWGGKQLARDVSKMVEDPFERVTNITDYGFPASRPKITGKLSILIKYNQMKCIVWSEKGQKYSALTNSSVFPSFTLANIQYWHNVVWTNCSFCQITLL